MIHNTYSAKYISMYISRLCIRGTSVIFQVLGIRYQNLGYQMKALIVPYHFWLKSYFPAQQIQPLEGDKDTWLLICLQNGDFAASRRFTLFFFGSEVG